MTEYNFNFKNSIFTKEAIKAAREKAIKKDVQDLTASSNDVKNLLEQKCDNAGVFRDLTDEEVEARLKAEDQSPLSLIKNLIGAKHKTPQLDSLPTAGAMEDFETVLIPNDGDSGVSQQLVTEFTPNSGDIGISQELETEFTPVENRANATSSLTIKDADGAKPQTLAAGDKLNVTYVYEDKTFNYTIEAKSAQNVTLQTKDGYFTVVGDNLAVQTGDEQYSFVALIGTTNSIKIGTNGKTYNGNSIAYNSDEGGHSIYTWGDDPTPGPGPDDPVDPVLTLGRAGSGSEYPSVGSITATSEEQTVLLKNPFTGKNYTYTIKTRQDIKEMEGYNPNSTFLDSQNVSFEFLTNGRLIITANYVDIVAGNNQNDDLILMGHFNNLDTGNNDDKVRVGAVVDSHGAYYISGVANYNEVGKLDTTYSANNGAKARGFAVTDTQWAYCAIGNHITTGEGDDHVSMLLSKYDDVASVDMGDGYDTFLTPNGNSKGVNYQYNIANAKIATNGKLKGIEIAHNRYEHDNKPSDSIDGWANQGESGGCLTLSFLNSLFHGQNNGNLEEDFGIIIEPLSDGSYDVTFSRYNCASYVPYDTYKGRSYTQPQNSVNKVNITRDLLIDSYGDIDSAILYAAICKLTVTNYPVVQTYLDEYENKNGKNSLTMIGYIGNMLKGLISTYFFNNSKSTGWKSIKSLSDTQLKNLIDHYKNGDLSNFEGQFQTSYVKKLGIIETHAYTIKDYSYDEQGVLYITLINPWDDRDCINLPFNYLKNSTDFKVMCFGYTDAQFDTYKDTVVNS